MKFPNPVRAIMEWFDKAPVDVAPKEAAQIIRTFVEGTDGAYDWDDFESVHHSDPQIDLAVRLCWYFARTFPARHPREYCGPDANHYFLLVADALETGRLECLDFETVKRELKNRRLEGSIRTALKIGDEVASD